jgi:hypothetical protein
MKLSLLKSLLCIFLGSFILLATPLFVRAAEPKTAEKSAAVGKNEEDKTNPLGTETKSNQKTASKPESVSLEKAGRLVGDYIASTTPAMSPYKFTVKELTTDDVWQRLSLQVFQVSSDFRQYETYLIKNEKVHPLGEAFGGWGVMSLCVANIRGDGVPNVPKLIYSYSFGSGLHRSHVAVWWEQDGKPQEAKVPFAYRGDMFVKVFADLKSEAIREGVAIEVGDYQQKINNWTTKAVLGTLVLTKKDDKITADVVLSEKLPEDVKKERIWK